LLYQRAQERYRTLEINDAGFRTDEMLEILADRSELTEFDGELYRKLVSRIIIYKNNTVEVVFLNGSSIKIGIQ
ncbi:MAG: recombinase, partial [Lachnospiraceae bacterium]|nr:recombinase [Lachnospiraceae bacterium]